MKIHICFYDRTFSTLVDALACLAQMVDSDDVIQLEIRRFNVLEDFYMKRVKKTFIQESVLMFGLSESREGIRVD